jgi:hypothetical protein
MSPEEAKLALRRYWGTSVGDVPSSQIDVMKTRAVKRSCKDECERQVESG